MSILQAVFLRSAWLKICTSLKPRPLISLSLVSLSQHNQQIYFFIVIVILPTFVRINCILLLENKTWQTYWVLSSYQQRIENGKSNLQLFASYDPQWTSRRDFSSSCQNIQITPNTFYTFFFQCLNCYFYFVIYIMKYLCRERNWRFSKYLSFIRRLNHNLEVSWVGHNSIGGFWFCEKLGVIGERVNFTNTS